MVGAVSQNVCGVIFLGAYRALGQPLSSLVSQPCMHRGLAMLSRNAPMGFAFSRLCALLGESVSRKGGKKMPISSN